MRALQAAPVDPLQAAHFTLLLRDRRSRVVVHASSVRFGHMSIGESDHLDGLLAPVRSAYLYPIAHAQLAMGLAALAIHFHFSADARALRLRSRSVQARDVQPDVE